MSHIHLPDGALPIQLVLAGLFVMAVLLFAATVNIRRRKLSSSLPRMAIVSAMLLVVMSIPFGFLPLHLNLSILAGIILGPWLAIYSAFIVNLSLAFVGHGTTAMVGLNTVILSAEMLCGYYLVRVMCRYLRPQVSAALAVIVTLVVTSSLLVGAIHGLGFNVEAMLHDHAHHDCQDHHEHEGAVPAASGGESSPSAKWTIPLLLGTLLLPVLVLEAIMTFLLVSVILRVRPGVLLLPHQSKA